MSAYGPRAIAFTYIAFGLSYIGGFNAYADASLQASLNRLKLRQAGVNQAMGNLGVPLPGLAPPRSSATADREEQVPLFRVHGGMDNLKLPQGRFLFGRVVNRLVVGAEGSPTVVEILPGQGGLSGMRLLGLAHQGAGQSRMNLDFKQLLFRGGKSIPVQATALDESGAYGLPAQVVSQKALSVMGALASSFVSGLAASQQSQLVNAFGFQQSQATGKNALLQGVAQTAADQSKRLIDEATTEKPILIVEPETAVTILIQEEVRW